MDDINLIYIFTAALVLSFGHCVGMCGGIVILYTRLLKEYNYYVKILGHILYALGRITTYCLIGGISACIGKLLSFNQTMSSIVFVLVGIIMLLLGVGLFFPKIIYFIEFNIFQINTFNKIFNKLFKKKNNLFAIYFIGFFNGMLPCSIVYFFALNASTQGSVFKGVLVMFIFGVATLFPMFLFGVFASIFDFMKYRKLVTKISAILIIFFGINTIIQGISSPHAMIDDNNHNNHHVMSHFE